MMGVYHSRNGTILDARVSTRQMRKNATKRPRETDEFSSGFLKPITMAITSNSLLGWTSRQDLAQNGIIKMNAIFP